MNFNVDRLWNQVLLEPQEVLKLIPANHNHLVLHLLFLFAQRVQLERGKQIANGNQHINIQGTTVATLFRIEFMKRSLLSENKKQEEESQLVSCLAHWQKKIKSDKDNQLIDLLASLKDDKMTFLRSKRQMHLFFLDCVVADLLKMMAQSKLSQKQFNSSLQEEKPLTLNKVDTQQLIKILNVSVPSVLHLIKLKPSELPYSLRQHSKSLLYQDKPLQWILKKSSKLAYFNKNLVQTLILQNQLNFSQQLNLARIVFRYFCVYHQQRKMMAVELLFQTYNKIDGPVRFALASQFSALLQIAEKVGKVKMVQAMANKSKWIEELQTKRSASQLSMEQGRASQGCLYGQIIILKPNEDAARYFEIVEEYSTACVRIQCQSEYQVQIDRVSDLEGRQLEEVVVGNQKTKTFTDRIVFKKCGIYKVSMSNAISWISTKKIVYNFNVLSPIELQSTTFQTQIWKASYISLGSYQEQPVSRLPYKEKILNAEVHIYRGENKYRFEIHPTKDSTRLSQQYQTDNEQRFLERMRSIFKAKEQLLFIFKQQQADRQLDSFEELSAMFESKVEKRQKSIVIEIPIKRDLN